VNTGSWQWVAGTGTDAAPYFRIFNPVLQSQKFDPSGDYIKRWVLELREMDSRMVHSPWKFDLSIKNYPAPIVEHQFARDRALLAYRSLE
jgi:deoxyribodipyrimidine photo-lyase